MKIKANVYMKYMMHNAGNLDVAYEIDMIKRTILIDVKWIDAELNSDFLKVYALHAINRKLEEMNKLPLATNIACYSVELILDGKINLDVQLVDRDFSPKEPTLVSKIKE
jgi:hypothetical protein